MAGKKVYIGKMLEELNGKLDTMTTALEDVSTQMVDVAINTAQAVNTFKVKPSSNISIALSNCADSFQSGCEGVIKILPGSVTLTGSGAARGGSKGSYVRNIAVFLLVGTEEYQIGIKSCSFDARDAGWGNGIEIPVNEKVIPAITKELFLSFTIKIDYRYSTDGTYEWADMFTAFSGCLGTHSLTSIVFKNSGLGYQFVTTKASDCFVKI